jgi:hypothetical protein
MQELPESRMYHCSIAVKDTLYLFNGLTNIESVMQPVLAFKIFKMDLG